MAKQRRPRVRPGPPKPARTPARTLPQKSVNGPRPQAGSTTFTQPPAPPVRRTSYLEAVARYEQGLDALQHHDYSRAADVLRSVLVSYPEEKELHERVRLYLNICERQAAPRDANPKTPEERVYAATLALNAGHYDEAIEHLRLVLERVPDHDHAEYMLAVVHAARGNTLDALRHLQRSLELNPDNRSLVLQEPDFEPLRENETFRSLLEAIQSPRQANRKSIRARSR
jgi:tetratricopeptide (TPR) repeat protein